MANSWRRAGRSPVRWRAGRGTLRRSDQTARTVTPLKRIADSNSEIVACPFCAKSRAQSQKHHALVFVLLTHDRRFVGAVFFLFLFVLVLFVFIRISGRHRVAHDHEGTPIDQPGGKFLGDVWNHAVAPRVWTLGDFTPSAVIRHANLTPLALARVGAPLGASIPRS